MGDLCPDCGAPLVVGLACCYARGRRIAKQRPYVRTLPKADRPRHMPSHTIRVRGRVANVWRYGNGNYSMARNLGSYKGGRA